MTPEYFSRAQIHRIHDIPPESLIHVIGVSGVAMAQLAMLLAAQGYRVSGSDTEFFDPMGALLRASPVQLFSGYDRSHIAADVACVVIGNAVGRSNPEVLEVEERGLPYTIFPAALADLCIGDRHSIVVCGTHGKTTTTALGAVALKETGYDPSYFVGGEVIDLPASLHAGSGRWSIVEGDEYDSAFFAKIPKFLFYRPTTMILTSIEYDHADIYSDLTAVEAAFDSGVALLRDENVLVACSDDPGVERLIGRWRGRGPRVVTYGTSPEASVHFSAQVGAESGNHQHVVVRGMRGDYDFRLSLPGLHNARNAVGMLTALEAVGLDPVASSRALQTFRGVKRRQQVRVAEPVTLIEDFAHHPTAVRETIAAIRSWYPHRRLIAVFEPRSNTSRRKVFEQSYAEAFDQADRVLLSAVTARERDKDVELMDTEALARQIRVRGVTCDARGSASLIAQTLEGEMANGDVVLVMSNGGFGGLLPLLEEAIKKRVSEAGK
jgi:UDP-N-acetylmuramate: L-alanyl-gamma-D-glutamyl-meso-diaminopimelate ligase